MAAVAAEAASSSPEPPVKIVEMPGRGRALIASRSIQAGEVLLSDSPLLLYPAAPNAKPYCSHCFRSAPSAPIRCPSCPSAIFCSAHCFSAALSSSHSPSLCRTLSSLPPFPDPELFAQARFLLAASTLSSCSFDRLMSLDSAHSAPAHQEAIFLHSLLGPITGLSLNATALLIAKDRRNAFGLMEPFDGGDRSVRAYGIYPNASLFNHDCLPNACHFDYLDRGSADITIRAIHDIPEGRELCLSYFPVNWGYKERQRRLLEDYEFHCRCDRCEIEKNWKDEEEEAGENAGDGDDDDDDFPHAYFFARFVCDQENCGGTLAPLPPSSQGAPAGLIECNVCGRLKNDDEDDDEDGMMLD